MRHSMLLLMTVVVLSGTSVTGVAQVSSPNLGALKLVSHLPPELPQRVMGLAFDGEKLWATVYLGNGRYATLDPATLTWQPEFASNHHKAIAKVAGEFASPGGICFANGKMWISGAYGGSFGAIDTQTWKVEQLVTGKQRAGRGSQSYSSIAFDGNYLWIAWHWFRYDLPVSQTQLLLKVDPQTGKVVAEYPAPRGTPRDVTHGLTWDGTSLWHMKDNRLSSIDPTTGEVTAQYSLNEISRPSGLAWVNDSLWIAEFDGKMWQLPFLK